MTQLTFSPLNQLYVFLVDVISVIIFILFIDDFTGHYPCSEVNKLCRQTNSAIKTIDFQYEVKIVLTSTSHINDHDVH